MSEKTCAARIGAEMGQRETEVGKLLAASYGEEICRHCGQVLDADKASEPCPKSDEGHEADPDYTEDSLYEFGLGVSERCVIRFDMSTGGPADWLEIIVNGNTVERVVYHFADWFDHAEEDVPEGSELFELAERAVEWVAS